MDARKETNPMVKLTNRTKGGGASTCNIHLEAVENFMIGHGKGAESVILMRHTVLDGGEYETNLLGGITTVRLLDEEAT